MNLDFSKIESGKKIYFASDFHLGVPNAESSLAREKKIIRWLNSIQKDATAIILVGDIFDFWFEYKNAIPKGFSRFQGKIAELTDQGVKVVFFTGNHDLWMKDYFAQELGVQVFTQPLKIEISGKKFLIGHGDGLGTGDYKYKFFKQVFLNPICQWLFRWLHPDIGMQIAKLWSGQSRNVCESKDDPFLGKSEKLIEYCSTLELKEHSDFYIFGHRHLPIDFQINDHSRYINLGQWFNQCNYAEYDGESLELIQFEAHA